MRKLGWLVMLASPALWANGLVDCQRDATSASCSAYLNGVVDSALMLGDSQVKARFGEQCCSLKRSRIAIYRKTGL